MKEDGAHRAFRLPKAVALGQLLFASPLGVALVAHYDVKLNLDALAADPYDNVSWNMKTDLLDKPASEASAIVFPKERLERMVRDVQAADYYADQKKWSTQVLAKNKIPMTTATIVHTPTLRLTKKMLNSVDNNLVQDLVAVPASLHSVFNPQFFVFSKGSRFQSATDFGLVDAYFCFGGACVIFGVKRSSLPGDDQDKQYENASNMSAQSFMDLAKGDTGFKMLLNTGYGVAIPGTFVFCVIVLDEKKECHGLRVQIVPTDGRKADCVGFLKKHVALHIDQNHGKIAALLELLQAD